MAANRRNVGHSDRIQAKSSSITSRINLDERSVLRPERNEPRDVAVGRQPIESLVLTHALHQPPIVTNFGEWRLYRLHGEAGTLQARFIAGWHSSLR